VTAPAPPQQQPPPVQPPPATADSDLDSPLFVTAVSAALLTAVPVAGVIAALKVRFALSHAAWTALSGVLGDVMAMPPPLTGVIGAASAQTSRMNTARRAQYVIAAAKRVMGSMRDARSQGTPALAAMRDQLATERRYYQQHQQAMWDRAKAAGMIDMEAAVHGNLLGWAAVGGKRGDGRTTAACREADGGNFYVDDPPDIGLPGIGPHFGCRCSAVAPWPGGRLLAGSGARRRR